MKKEEEMVAKQEEYEKEAAAEVVVDTTPRPIPPEVTQSLPTVTEDEEEDAEKKGNLDRNILIIKCIIYKTHACSNCRIIYVKRSV